MFDRKTHWQNIYRDKSAREVSWYQKTPALSLELVHATGIDRDAPVIDVGGGASVLVDHLLADGYTRVAVLDISANALDSARQRLGDAANAVSWIEADITQFSPPQPYALWHDRAVFHFLTEPSDRARYVDTLTSALQPDGHLVLAAFAIGGPTRCSGLEIVQYDADKLAAELGAAFRLVEERSETHLTPGNTEQKFGYFRFQYRP